MIKKHIGYHVAILACIVLEIFFLIMLILSILPPTQKERIEVPTPLGVSTSAIHQDGGEYVLQLSGSLIYRGEGNLRIDRLLVTLGDGEIQEIIEVDGFVLHSKVEREVFFEWTGDTSFDRVHSVVAVQGEKRISLANTTSSIGLNFNVILYAVLGAAVILIGIYLGKQRYYLAQEDRMKEKASD